MFHHSEIIDVWGLGINKNRGTLILCRDKASSSPPVTPNSISNNKLILAILSKYFLQMEMLSSKDSSDKSNMWEENSGSPFFSKYLSSNSKIPRFKTKCLFIQRFIGD